MHVSFDDANDTSLCHYKGTLLGLMQLGNGSDLIKSYSFEHIVMVSVDHETVLVTMIFSHQIFI